MDEFEERVARQFGRHFRRRRHFLDLSQEAVALRAGIHRTQMTYYENGKRLPLAGTLVKLAAALDVSIDQLLGGVEWEVPGPPLGDPDEDVGGNPPAEIDDA